MLRPDPFFIRNQPFPVYGSESGETARIRNPGWNYVREATPISIERTLIMKNFGTETRYVRIKKFRTVDGCRHHMQIVLDNIFMSAPLLH